MNHHLGKQFRSIYTELQALEASINVLEKEKCHQSLQGHQTVNSSEAIALSLHKLQTAIREMEDTLVMIQEATGEKGKL